MLADVLPLSYTQIGFPALGVRDDWDGSRWRQMQAAYRPRVPLSSACGNGNGHSVIYTRHLFSKGIFPTMHPTLKCAQQEREQNFCMSVKETLDNQPRFVPITVTVVENCLALGEPRLPHSTRHGGAGEHMEALTS
jgi:hypothetical protein